MQTILIQTLENALIAYSDAILNRDLRNASHLERVVLLKVEKLRIRINKTTSHPNFSTEIARAVTAIENASRLVEPNSPDHNACALALNALTGEM